MSHFKAFQEDVEVALAPITLLYGANSSGKSSLLQSLLLWRQTLATTSNASAVLTFRGDEATDLGNFENLVYAHNTKHSFDIGVGIEFKPPARRIRAVGRSPQNARDAGPGKATKAMVVISFATSKTADVYVEQAQYFLNNEKFPFAILKPAAGPGLETGVPLVPGTPRAISFKASHLDEKSSYFEAAFKRFSENDLPRRLRELRNFHKYFSANGADFTRLYNLGSDDAKAVEEIIKRLESYSFADFMQDVHEEMARTYFTMVHFLPGTFGVVSMPDTDIRRKVEFVVNSWSVADTASQILTISTQLRNEIVSLGYIGPLREFPERNYIYTGSKADSVGSRGEHLPHILFSEEQHQADLNDLAQDLGLGYEIKVTQSRNKALNNVFAVRLVDKKTKTNVGINDVGFGISQVLPILLQSVLAGQSTVLIEQPEIHLHPRLQAALAEIISRSTKGTIRRQFIVETHSEHILLRLQRLIRAGDIASSDVKVLFVTRDRSGSHISELRLDKNGDLLDHWPDGFFDEAYNEVFG